MSNFYQPLRDVFADAAAHVQGDDGATEIFPSTSAAFPLGELGGVIFTADERRDGQVLRFQQVGGAVYRSLLPFGAIPAALEDDTVSRRAARRAAERKRSGVAVNTIRALLSITAFPLFPLLRSIVPRRLLDIAGSETLVDERRRDLHRNLDMVVAMAFHHHLPILALATRDASQVHRVQLYDVALEVKMPVVLTHALQSRGVHALAWKPHSRDTLMVGCEGGVLCWSITAGAAMHQVRRNGGISQDVHPYGPLWGSIADDTPIAVWLPCSPDAPMSSVVFSSDGRYIACASEHSTSMHVHDVSMRPRDSLVIESVAVEGGTCSLCFAPPDDGFLVRAIRSQCRVKLLSTATFRTETIVTEAPVSGVVALEASSTTGRSSTPSAGVFALQYADTEGVVLAKFFMDDSPACRGAIMVVLGLVSTGLHRGVGGAVQHIAADGKRLFLRVKSGHVVVVSIACHSEQAWSVRGVGCIAPSPTTPAAFYMTTSPSFQKGSLLAVTHGAEVRFFPSYYTK
jgi:WD40 repeat protein